MTSTAPCWIEREGARVRAHFTRVTSAISRPTIPSPPATTHASGPNIATPRTPTTSARTIVRHPTTRTPDKTAALPGAAWTGADCIAWGGQPGRPQPGHDGAVSETWRPQSGQRKSGIEAMPTGEGTDGQEQRSSFSRRRSSRTSEAAHTQGHRAIRGHGISRNLAARCFGTLSDASVDDLGKSPDFGLLPRRRCVRSQGRCFDERRQDEGSVSAALQRPLLADPAFVVRVIHF